MTIQWKAVEQYFTVVLFVFHFTQGVILKKNVNVGFCSVRSERATVKVVCFTAVISVVTQRSFNREERCVTLITAVKQITVKVAN